MPTPIKKNEKTRNVFLSRREFSRYQKLYANKVISYLGGRHDSRKHSSDRLLWQQRNMCKHSF